MAITRRGFVQFLARGTGAVVAVGVAWKSSVSKVFHEVLPSRSVAPGNQKWVMVIDLAKCDGCRDCTKACTKMHFVPPMQEWIKVYEVADNEAAGSYFLPRPCMHCDNPPCVRGCPVGATYKRTDGIVMMDQDRCIGCRNCIAQCPYSARFVQLGRAPAHARGNEPAVLGGTQLPAPQGRRWRSASCARRCCAWACFPPARTPARWARSISATNSRTPSPTAKARPCSFPRSRQTGAGFRLMEELGTEPRVYYLPPVNRKYPSPEEKHMQASANRNAPTAMPGMEH